MDGSGGREEEDVHMIAGDGGGTDSAAVGAAAMMYSSTDYTQHNVYGHLIEVPNKYCPPIQPIGRGAYGIVWLDTSRICSSSFFSVVFVTSCLSPTINCLLVLFWFVVWWLCVAEVLMKYSSFDITLYGGNCLAGEFFFFSSSFLLFLSKNCRCFCCAMSLPSTGLIPWLQRLCVHIGLVQNS
jgi:hypothetical protein